MQAALGPRTGTIFPKRQRDLPTSCIEFSHYRFVGNDGYQDVVLRIAGPAQLQTFEQIIQVLLINVSTPPQGFGAPLTLYVLKF